MTVLSVAGIDIACTKTCSQRMNELDSGLRERPWHVEITEFQIDSVADWVLHSHLFPVSSIVHTPAPTPNRIPKCLALYRDL